MSAFKSLRVVRQILGVLAQASLLTWLFAGFSGCSADETPTCVPGQSIACVTSGCSGYQVCKPDGKSYAACVCEDPSGQQFPATGPNSGRLGAQCETSDDCRAGLECLGVDSTLIGGEGPSAGMCLAKCLPDHDFCQGLDARSKCIVLSDAGTPANKADDAAYCLPGCELGTQPNESDKCRGRVDLVCSESVIGSGVGFCRPACRDDRDCSGRHCNLGSGLCGDSARTGEPIGTLCDVAASPSACSGGCYQQSEAYALCSGVCSYGTPGCGQSDTSGKLDYFCAIQQATRSANGDLGYCAFLCDCDDDCDRTDAVCEPNPGLSGKTGRAGVCGSRNLPSGGKRKNKAC